MAKKRAGIARRTISLPQDLDRRMEKHDINWSEVARLAFESKLREIEPKKPESNNMQDLTQTIERLRQLNAEEAAEVTTDGIREGREWAKAVATPKQLRRLEKYWENVDPDAFSAAPFDVATVIIGPDADRDRSDCEDFWDTAIGDDEDRLRDDSDFVEAFVVGAMQIWDQVKSQI